MKAYVAMNSKKIQNTVKTESEKMSVHFRALRLYPMESSSTRDSKQHNMVVNGELRRRFKGPL